MKILRPLIAFATFLFRLGACSVLLLSIQFALVVVARAQTPTTLQGRVLYQFPDNSSLPAVGVTVTMTKTIYDVSPPVVSTQTTTTDGNGHYSFQSQFRCSVTYQFQAVSAEIVDEEPLPRSGISSTGGCVGDATLGNLDISKPMPITLAGYVLDERGNRIQGITVTMTRTKYDLNPNVVTTATTSTDANGHYQFATFSRCSVVELFRASIGSYTFPGSVAPSGCIVGSYDNLNLVLEFNPGRDAGSPGCHGVGKPVNVTNGNVYLQQTDYHLPGIGEAIDITRAYNSSSQKVGLFGRGWTSLYDESVKTVSGTLLEFRMSDGRVVTGGITPDFFGQIVKNGNGTYTVTFKDGRVHQFNSSGKLLSLRDPNGNQTTLAYGANGYLTSVTDPFGRLLTFTANANGQILSISDTLGTIASYTYNSSQLRGVTYADNSAYNFAYQAGGGGYLLSDVTDALGNTVEHHDYDSQSRALTSEAQGGVERYTLSYVSQTETDVRDALGHMTKYFFNSVRGRNAVTRIEGACGCGGEAQVRNWSYDNQLNVTSKTDALGHVTSYTLDGKGNPLTLTDATGTVAVTYNQFGDPLTLTDQLNGTTTNTYDAQGNLLTTKDALNATTSFTYNSRGQVLTATDARGKVTTSSYDASGNLTQSKDANNTITFYFYDARGRLTKVRDGLSRNSLYAYDAAGRLNKLTHPDNSFVSFTYDLAGRRTTITDERGNVTNYAYDSAYHLTSMTDALGHTTSNSYDAMSNLTGTTDALARVTNYDYDNFNRLVKITHPPATAGAARLFETLSYDAVGNIKQRTDTAGRITNYAYDNVNRLISTTDADNKPTSLEYDALSRATALTDALNQRYQFAYDAVGRQTGVTRAGASMSYAYDVVGNVTQRTDYNGTVTNYAYDNLNRPTTIAYPTRTVTYAYTVMGQLSRATNENGSVYIAYDNRYRVSSFSDPFYYGLSYNYDAAGNRTKLSLNGTTYATYTYDAVNRLTNLKDGGNLNFPHTYDAVNRLTTRSVPNGVTSSYTYDGLDRLTALTQATSSNTLINNQYTYNDANNIAAWNNASGNHVFGYDAVDRLSSATNNAQPNENYAYDGVGNRTTSHLSASYSYQPFNKLTSTSAASYSYDSNGNLLSRSDASGTTTFSWNEENQLTQVTLPSGLTVNYKYDALGRRLQRTTSAGANERYVYDGADVLLDLNADWSVATKYLNGPGVDNHLRQTSTTTGVSYFLTDHLGSTAGLTDAGGSMVEQLAYDSFGNSTASTRTRYGYTGRERDPDAGMLYYRARWYDPQAGRFISEDPIRLAGGINQYGYVGNNPLNANDPSGLYEIDVHYYLTYFLARRTGCFTSDEARLIADADQATDENDTTSPGPGWTAQQQKQNRENHDLQPGNHEGQRSPELWRQAMNGPTNYVGLGQALHFLQDSFSHEGFESDAVGHISRLHYYDKTDSDVPRALRMAGATWDALNQYAKEKKCGCQGKWDPEWWSQVIDFSRTQGANFGLLETIDSNGEIENFGMTNDTGYLGRKRRILNLGPR
ncbi:MAG: DUF6765 family protein [Pyrinomonadaceae bacterium]